MVLCQNFVVEQKHIAGLAFLKILFFQFQVHEHLTGIIDYLESKKSIKVPQSYKNLYHLYVLGNDAGLSISTKSRSDFGTHYP